MSLYQWTQLVWEININPGSLKNLSELTYVHSTTISSLSTANPKTLNYKPLITSSVFTGNLLNLRVRVLYLRLPDIERPVV